MGIKLQHSFRGDKLYSNLMRSMIHQNYQNGDSFGSKYKAFPKLHTSSIHVLIISDYNFHWENQIVNISVFLHSAHGTLSGALQEIEIRQKLEKGLCVLINDIRSQNNSCLYRFHHVSGSEISYVVLRWTKCILAYMTWEACEGSHPPLNPAFKRDLAFWC
jgi:hypothetical protein